MHRILFCCAATPSLAKLKVLLPKVMPYVDDGILILGDPNCQETLDYIKEFEPKLKYEIYPWHDSFGDTYTQFMKYGSQDTWLLILDDDEVPSEGMMQSLRGYINNSDNGNKYSIVEFKVNPISEGTDLGPANYYRQMLIKWTPQMHYKIDLHQQIYGHFNNRCVRSEQIYYHIKSLRDEYKSACRNWWIGGIWHSGPRIDGEKKQEWYEMKSIVAMRHPDVKIFNNLASKLIDKTIHRDFLRWICYYNKKFEGHGDYNELRAFHGYYYQRLHPDEEPIEVDTTRPLMEQLEK